MATTCDSITMGTMTVGSHIKGNCETAILGWFRPKT